MRNDIQKVLTAKAQETICSFKRFSGICQPLEAGDELK